MKIQDFRIGQKVIMNDEDHGGIVQGLVVSIFMGTIGERIIRIKWDDSTYPIDYDDPDDWHKINTVFIK